MPRIVYVNGRYVPYAEASVHVEDRDFHFPDGVYEVCEVRDGRLVDEDRHLARLGALSQRDPRNRERARCRSGPRHPTTHRVQPRSRGSVYLQVTRGAAPRDFPFPVPAVAKTMVVIAPYWATLSVSRPGGGRRASRSRRCP